MSASANLPAHWAFVRPVAPCQRFVDHRDADLIQYVVWSDDAAFAKRNLEQAEVVGADNLMARELASGVGRIGWDALDGVRNARRIAQRQRERHRGGLDARNCCESIEVVLIREAGDRPRRLCPRAAHLHDGYIVE